MDSKVLKYYADSIDQAQEELFTAQRRLIEIYKQQWMEMNYLVNIGHWPEKAVYLANAYALKVDDETYIFQLNAPLPFLPNPYYMRFKKSRDEFIAAKLFISLQLLDVIKQLECKPIERPVALIIKHYYSGNVRLFDIDNKAKQVVINTFRNRLINDDNVKSLSYYSEEGIHDMEDRTMLYLGLAEKRLLLETEIASQYPRIDHLPEVIVSKHPADYYPQCPPGRDISSKGDNDNPDNQEEKFVKNRGWEGDFM